VLFVVALSAAPAFAAPPALRDQVSLNGQWDEGGTVPNYFGETFKTKTYRRQVEVPPAWTGKQIHLEFRQVNFTADVSINGQHVLTHIGCFIPFSIDLTKLVQPGKSFALEVVVKGSTQEPYVDAQGGALWPASTYRLDNSYSGIVDDVWLRAYGPVSIDDAFIETSYRLKMLMITYTVTNHDPKSRTVRINGEVTEPGAAAVVKTLGADEITLAPSETKSVLAQVPWEDAKLWMPDSPTLYHLTSSVLEGDKSIDGKPSPIDKETRRFGFREIWIKGNQFVLNGIRANLWGDSIPRVTHYTTGTSPSEWPKQVDMMMNTLHVRIIRWHMVPAQDYLLDVSDEKGLLVEAESSMYGRPIYSKDRAKLVENTKSWLHDWIRSNRNHPSIVIWSADNECGWMHLGCIGKPPLTNEQLLDFGNTIRQNDTTRPVVYEGDGDVGDAVIDYHYPEGYLAMPRQPPGRSHRVWPPAYSIYGWGAVGPDATPQALLAKVPAWHEGNAYGPYLDPNKPTCFGEILFLERPTKEMYWWHGTWTRGLRYCNYTNIRPFMGRWAWRDDQPESKLNYCNSFNPVALFDKAYDDLGVAPLMKHEWPEVLEGATLNRTLVLYNDEFRDTSVTFEVQIRSGEKTYASGKKTIELPLGEHVDIPYTLVVPKVGGQEMQMVLSTYKNGEKKFEEARIFKVAGADSVPFGEIRVPKGL
jgi:hypothetical protein